MEVPLIVCSPTRGRGQAAEHDQRVEQRSRSTTEQNPTGRDRWYRYCITGSCRVAALVQLIPYRDRYCITGSCRVPVAAPVQSITYSCLCYCSGGAFLLFGYGCAGTKTFMMRSRVLMSTIRNIGSGFGSCSHPNPELPIYRGILWKSHRHLWNCQCYGASVRNGLPDPDNFVWILDPDPARIRIISTFLSETQRHIRKSSEFSFLIDTIVDIKK